MSALNIFDHFISEDGSIARIAKASGVISYTKTRAVITAIEDELSENRSYNLESGKYQDKEDN